MTPNKLFQLEEETKVLEQCITVSDLLKKAKHDWKADIKYI